MKSVIFNSLVILWLICAAGCGVQSGRQIDIGKVHNIQRGKTTKAEILQDFRKPQFTSQSDKGEVWTYYNMDAGYFLPVGAMAGGTKQQNLSITFDGNVVKDYSWSSMQGN